MISRCERIRKWTIREDEPLFAMTTFFFFLPLFLPVPDPTIPPTAPPPPTFLSSSSINSSINSSSSSSILSIAAVAAFRFPLPCTGGAGVGRIVGLDEEDVGRETLNLSLSGCLGGVLIVGGSVEGGSECGLMWCEVDKE